MKPNLKDVNQKAFQCGRAGYNVIKMQNVLNDTFGDVSKLIPKNYTGETPIEAYMKGIGK